MHAVAARTEVPKISWHVISKGALVNRLKTFHHFHGPSHPSHPSHANETQEEFFGLVPYLGTGEKPFSCSDTVTIQKQQDWATYGNSENIENVSNMTLKLYNRTCTAIETLHHPQLIFHVCQLN